MDRTGNGPGGLPDWVPDSARLYLQHTEDGMSLRAIARDEGVHASTVLRRVRRMENRRDDPLVDEALNRLAGQGGSAAAPGPGHDAATNSTQDPRKDADEMNATDRRPSDDDAAQVIDREARRILRRLQEPGACLAVAADMEKAVVVRDTEDGRTVRTAVVDREIAQGMALRDWIETDGDGRVRRYRITQAGRAALRRLMAAEESQRAGFAEAQAGFGDQHRVWGTRELRADGARRRVTVRFNMAESPVTALARRKDKGGAPFLAEDLVAAGERLREDFELAQMGPSVTQNWDRFMAGGERGQFKGDGFGTGPQAARDRVASALRDLGPGLGDVVLRCCCFLEGLETAERRLGWSSRSGKIVLRIGLQRLKRHYEENGGLYGAMIG